MALLIVSVPLFMEEEILLALACFVTGTMLLVFVLDIRGVQVDLRNQQFREYIVRPWGKTGNWIPLQNLVAVELYREQYYVKIKAIFSNLADARAPNYNHERHWRYALYFTCNAQPNQLLLMESHDIHSCVRFGRTAAKRLKVPFRNYVK